MGPTLASRPETAANAAKFAQRFGRRRDLAGLPLVLARAGELEARLAVTKLDIRRAQKLRYRAFFEEGGALAGATTRLLRRDVCRFDRVCDHLVVVDKTMRSRDGAPKLVGVYRLLRQEVAERNFGFYSSCEFDVDALIARRPSMRFLEVGRACIASSHRGRHVLDLLWRGIWSYARHHGMDALIGCASLPGVAPAAHSRVIRALAGSAADLSWTVAPRSERAGALHSESVPPPADMRSLARILPPLVKGYWRLGATFSPIPAVDRAFGTTDIFVVLPLSDIDERYLRHFAVAPAPRPLAA